MARIPQLYTDTAPTSTDYAITYDVETGATRKTKLGDGIIRVAPKTPIASKTIEFSAIVNSIAELPTNSESVRLHALGDCFIEFGTSSVTTSVSSIYMPAGTEIFGIPANATHIAVKGAGVNGALNVTGALSNSNYQITTSLVLPYTGASSSTALPSGDMVRIFALTDCFIEFGDLLVEATNESIFFAAGTEYITVPDLATHIAAKRYTLDGAIYISGAY